jgi:hypothetical protein
VATHVDSRRAKDRIGRASQGMAKRHGHRQNRPRFNREEKQHGRPARLSRHGSSPLRSSERERRGGESLCTLTLAPSRWSWAPWSGITIRRRVNSEGQRPKLGRIGGSKIKTCALGIGSLPKEDCEGRIGQIR